MTQENKYILLRLLQQHQELGISDQIDFEKFYLYSIITHSTAIEGSTVTIASTTEKMVDKQHVVTKMVDSQLTEFGYLQALGGNKNRTYRKK